MVCSLFLCPHVSTSKEGKPAHVQEYPASSVPIVAFQSLGQGSFLCTTLVQHSGVSAAGSQEGVSHHIPDYDLLLKSPSEGHPGIRKDAGSFLITPMSPSFFFGPYIGSWQGAFWKSDHYWRKISIVCSIGQRWTWKRSRQRSFYSKWLQVTWLEDFRPQNTFEK